MAERPPADTRDGTAQTDRARPELAPGRLRLDDRTPAELIAFVQGYAAHLRWYGPDGMSDGDWSAMFAGLAATAGPDTVSHAEAAAFLADPAAFTDPRFAALRRPHLMLLLACVRLLRHGQDAIDAIADRHHDHLLREVLGLAPAPARPDRAFVLFDLAAGIAAAEAPAGLRLLAGRDARRRDRVFRLDERLVVTRARVARLATGFVDREVFDLDAARRTTAPGTDARLRAVLGLAYGSPRPGDPMPLLLGEPLTVRGWGALETLLGFGPAVLHLSFAELRDLAQRKRRRDLDVGEWAQVNATLEAAGRAARGDPAWRLQPRDPRAFAANLLAAYGRDPMERNGLEEVDSIDDLYLALDRPEAAAFVRDRLRMDVADFVAMMERKRASDTDWRVVAALLVAAGRRRHGGDWTLPRGIPATDFARALDAAVGPIGWGTVGLDTARDVVAYLARVAAVEAWFALSAEEIARLLPLLAVPQDDARGWQGIAALLTKGHAARVAAEEAAAMRALRVGGGGLVAAIAEATGEPATAGDLLEPLARWTSADRLARVRAALDRPGAVDAAGWSRVDAALAAARRRRLALPDPMPRRAHRHALWADAFAPPAAPAEARPGFGALPADPDAVSATLGWAIASPALALSAGHRQVTLTLVFAEDDGGALLATAAGPAPFTVELGVEGAWHVPADCRFAEATATDAFDAARPEPDRRRIVLTLDFALDEAQPPVATPADGAPMLRLRLRPVNDGARVTTALERFRTLRLLRATLRSRVGVDGGAGLWPLELETEGGRVDGKRPFEPFGGVAPPGATLAIGHPDLAGKRLTALALRWQWQGAPADPPAYYINYPDPRFTASLALADGRAPSVPLAAKLPLFVKDTAAIVRTAVPGFPIVSAPDLRFPRLLLTLDRPGFGHAVYPALAMEKAAALAADPEGKPADYLVRPPYTPRLRHLSLEIVAEHAVDLVAYRRASAVDRVYHLHPFGRVEAPDAPTPAAAAGWPLLPAYEEEGALYVGLEQVDAPATVSLLIDTVATGDGGARPAGLRWSYLDADGWRDLPEPPRDDTGGLVRSGLVRAVLPAASPDGRMPAGLYWLRATVTSGAAAADAIAGIHAQAGSATLVDADPDAVAHAPLPAGTIRSVADPVPGLARVRQPHPSFDGAAAEDAAALRLRAAELLRHKGRALTAWDYERLVLDRFPAVHRVKCLPATMVDGPGRVRLVIVPDARALRLADPFAPRAPAAMLDDIVTHLRPLAPEIATIEAGHPRFVRVRARLAVRFRDAGDDAFQKRRLTDAINRHLAPWAFGADDGPALGGRIDAAALVAFVDGLPFVDFVAGCRLFQAEEGADFRPGAIGAGESAFSELPDALLVPAAEHEIDLIDDAAGAGGEQGFGGVGHMKIGLDLIVASDQPAEEE